MYGLPAQQCRLLQENRTTEGARFRARRWHGHTRVGACRICTARVPTSFAVTPVLHGLQSGDMRSQEQTLPSDRQLVQAHNATCLLSAPLKTLPHTKPPETQFGQKPALPSTNRVAPTLCRQYSRKVNNRMLGR